MKLKYFSCESRSALILLPWFKCLTPTLFETRSQSRSRCVKYSACVKAIMSRTYGCVVCSTHVARIPQKHHSFLLTSKLPNVTKRTFYIIFLTLNFMKGAFGSNQDIPDRPKTLVLNLPIFLLYYFGRFSLQRLTFPLFLICDYMKWSENRDIPSWTTLKNVWHKSQLTRARTYQFSTCNLPD